MRVSQRFIRGFRLCQRYDIIQKLLWVTMTHIPIDRVEVPIGLIAQLSYYQESKTTDFLGENKHKIVHFSCSKDNQSDVNERCSGNSNNP